MLPTAPQAEGLRELSFLLLSQFSMVWGLEVLATLKEKDQAASTKGTPKSSWGVWYLVGPQGERMSASAGGFRD